MTYGRLFRYANRELAGCRVVIANADIFFDRTLARLDGYDLAGLGSAASLDEPQYEKAPLEDILPMTFPVDPKLKVKVREQVQATVSQQAWHGLQYSANYTWSKCLSNGLGFFGPFGDEEALRVGE